MTAERIVIAHLFYGSDKKSMLLSRIAPDYSGAMVRTSHICAQNLFWKRLVKVYEQVLVKLKVTHYLYAGVYMLF